MQVCINQNSCRDIFQNCLYVDLTHGQNIYLQAPSPFYKGITLANKWRKILKRYSWLFNFLLFAFVVFSQHSQESIDQATVKDIDGNVYKTIRIGDQTWMAENLKTTHYSDGALIPIVPEQGAWSRLKTGALCWYENDPLSYKDVYGALYNSYAVADSRKLCPPGWHVPTIAEWQELEDYLEVAKISESPDRPPFVEHYRWKLRKWIKDQQQIIWTSTSTDFSYSKLCYLLLT